MGSINHELNIRGAKELKAASSAHVKAKGRRLDFGKVIGKKFIKMIKKGGEIPPALNSGNVSRRS